MMERIEISPRVCGGKPVIAGTRIPVTVILALLESGEAWDAILAAYPELEVDDIPAALHYAKAAVDNTEIAVSVAE